MFKIIISVLISSLFCLLSGCASIVSGTNQSLSIKTPPVTGANCKLQNDKGIWFINKTPGSVVVHRSYRDLLISCSKPGYAKASERVKSLTRPIVAGNIVFGGFLGAGVDAADGAAYNYPRLIKVPMRKK